MKNKKTLMAFSAILILIFHLWIYVFGGNGAEAFIKQTAFIGVDIFFFLSAYSLAGREIEDYGAFLSSRFKAVYLKFFIFAVVALIYKKWELSYFFQVVTGVDLIKKGGGAFLWFLPAIMIFYIVFPVFNKWDKRNRWVTLVVVSVIWIVVALSATKQKELYPMFIYWNRIPIFLLGYYAAVLPLYCEDEIYKSNKASLGLKASIGFLLTVIGYVLVYMFAYKARLQVPIRDMFYITVIPVCVGLILLVGLIPEVAPIKLIGSATLEMYAIQMIFGYDVGSKLLKITGSRGFSNCGTLVFVIVVSVVCNLIYSYIVATVRNRKK